jgi:hypothetical protein
MILIGMGGGSVKNIFAEYAMFEWHYAKFVE